MIKEHSIVTLNKDTEIEFTIIPAGTIGTVVFVFSGFSTTVCMVEFIHKDEIYTHLMETKELTLKE